MRRNHFKRPFHTLVVICWAQLLLFAEVFNRGSNGYFMKHENRLFIQAKLFAFPF